MSEQIIWKKRKLKTYRRCWFVGTRVKRTDIIVYLGNFIGFGGKNAYGKQHEHDLSDDDKHYEGEGLWVLRHIAEGENALVACLNWGHGDRRQFYDHWDLKNEATMEAETTSGLHKLAIDVRPYVHDHPPISS